MAAGNRIRRTAGIFLGIMVSVEAAAQQADPDQQQRKTVLEEVIVTAAKKEQSIADVASTVNVVTGEQLESFRIFEFKDVEKLTPGLELSAVSPRSWSITMRGAPFDPDSSAAATVVTYWNGMPVLPNVAFAQVFDLQRIEVLRGAQGTLQGETSPSGSIQIHTTEAAVDATNGYLRQTFADDGGTVSELAAGTPLIEDKLGVRVAAVLNEDPNESKSVFTGQDGHARTKAGRINFFALPVEDLDISLTYEYMEQDADALALSEGRPQLISPNPVLGSFDRRSLEEAETTLFRRHELVDLTINYEFLDHTLTLANGYEQSSQLSIRDLDGGNVFPGYAVPQSTKSQFENFSHELRLTNNDPDFWEYLVGAYYNKRKSDTLVLQRDPNVFFYNPASGEPPIPGVPGLPDLGVVTTRVVVPTVNESVAAFFNSDLHFTDDLTATLGVRWQHSRQSRNLTAVADGDINFGTFVLPDGTVLAQLPESYQESSDDALTGVLRVAYDLSPELMIYASYARSFRPGGSVIMTTLGADPSLVVYDEELSDNYEIGFKQYSENGRYQLSGAVYYQKFDGFIQRNNNTPADIDGDGIIETRLSGINFNADVIIRGAELEGRALITQNWEVFLSASYNDAKFDDASVPCGDIGDTADPGSQIRTCESNGRVGSSPHWTATAGTEYSFPVFDFGSDAYVRGLYRYTGERIDDFAVFNTALYDEYRLDDYGVLDLYVGLRSQDGRWDVSAWVTNLADEEAMRSIGGEDVKGGVNVAGGASVLRTGYSSVQLIPERTAGITGTWRFGD